jgi:hypothetical protein
MILLTCKQQSNFFTGVRRCLYWHKYQRQEYKYKHDVMTVALGNIQALSKENNSHHNRITSQNRLTRQIASSWGRKTSGEQRIPVSTPNDDIFTHTCTVTSVCKGFRRTWVFFVSGTFSFINTNKVTVVIMHIAYNIQNIGSKSAITKPCHIICSLNLKREAIYKFPSSSFCRFSCRQWIRLPPSPI